MRQVNLTAAVVLVLDQFLKFIVLYGLRLDERERLDVLPPWLGFRMAWNKGINFGLFANSADLARWLLIGLALVISVWIWVWVRRQPHRPVVLWSAGLLIGGAIGNVIDRIRYGAVADFLNMSVPGLDNPYSFNLADVAIFFGALGLVIFTGREKTP